VALGLFGEPWLRSRGAVECVIGEDDWFVQRGSSTEVEERTLRVAFLNHKDVPVAVWDMRVEFYREGEPLAEWARPKVHIDEGGKLTPVGPVNLAPHIPVPLTLRVVPGRDDISRELGKMDRAEFVATLVGAPDKRKELKPPWRHDS
jgi:hypothetical protein